MAGNALNQPTPLNHSPANPSHPLTTPTLAGNALNQPTTHPLTPQHTHQTHPLNPPTHPSLTNHTHTPSPPPPTPPHPPSTQPTPSPPSSPPSSPLIPPPPPHTPPSPSHTLPPPPSEISIDIDRLVIRPLTSSIPLSKAEKDKIRVTTNPDRVLLMPGERSQTLTLSISIPPVITPSQHPLSLYPFTPLSHPPPLSLPPSHPSHSPSLTPSLTLTLTPLPPLPSHPPPLCHQKPR